MTATFTATTYEAIAEGVYPAQLVSIERAPSDAFGEFLKWTFNLRLPDGSRSELSAASSTATGPKSKGYRWASVLLGHVPAPGSAEDLTGKVCQIHVIVNEEGFNRVEAVLPASPANPETPVMRPIAVADDPASSALPF